MREITIKVKFDDRRAYKAIGETEKLIMQGINDYMKIDLEDDGVIENGWITELVKADEEPLTYSGVSEIASDLVEEIKSQFIIENKLQDRFEQFLGARIIHLRNVKSVMNQVNSYVLTQKLRERRKS